MPTTAAIRYVLFIVFVRLLRFSCLIDSYLDEGSASMEFDYSLIREYGAPINGFGGVASGPEPLQHGLAGIKDILSKRAKSDNPLITSVDITDIMNIIGKILEAIV